ncbi:MAG TPA: bifunctional phosphoserine phosphatase/homoserine phosphotransferase ThrH [Spirochaetota bacterium]|nr:bifunctional phosphoserine phosphatase/homoserine phosphotransferase ThrH [Spirochaetota bacterium]
MRKKPFLIATDMEGVLTPEVWINVARRTGIEKLKLTTRDINNYDKLMRYRLRILAEHKIKLSDIRAVIATMEPLPGAKTYLDWIRANYELIILSDTFYEFARPFMKKLGYPTLFCHTLETDKNNMIIDYHLRIKDGKKKAVLNLKKLGFKVMAIGDSYNDTTMLKAADQGLLFKAPPAVKKEFPRFPTAETYTEAKKIIKQTV